MSRSLLLVAAFSIALVPALMAADKAEKKGGPIHGTIKSVDAKAMSIVLSAGHGDKAKDITITVNDKTKITLDAKEAKLEDLKEGMKVTAKADENNLATEVAAVTAKENKKDAK